MQGSHPPPTTSQRHSEHWPCADDSSHRCPVLRHFTYRLCVTLTPFIMRDIQIYDSAEQIQMYRMMALKGALRLEILGMRKKGRSAYSLAKEEFGFKGDKRKVLKQLELKIEETVIADALRLSIS